MAVDETELIGRIRAGDARAFELVFRRHYPALVRFARAGLGSEAEAEDAVHDVFLRIWRNRDGLHVERSLRIYLFAATRNRMVDVLRHRALTQPHAGSASRDRDGADAEFRDPRSDASHVPVDPAELAELDDAIQRAIRNLPERGRTAFVLCREQEMTYAEAAVVMGVSPATVKTHIARAMAALRVALEPFLVALLCIPPLLR